MQPVIKFNINGPMNGFIRLNIDKMQTSLLLFKTPPITNYAYFITDGLKSDLAPPPNFSALEPILELGVNANQNK